MKLDERKQREKPQKRKSERLSQREWENLMGQHEPVYQRRRGAIRRKY